MNPRVPPPEDGRDSSQKTPPRAFPVKILKFLLLFLVLGVGFLLVTMSMTRYFGVEGLVSATRIGFQPCVEERSSLSQWIRPPSNLMHFMTDEELFWRASFTPQVKKYPFRRVSKIAFMFLSKGPLPLYPLWERFLRGNEGLYSIYVHSLPSYQPEFPPASPFYGRQVPSQVSEWGQMSMCDAERRLLANALLDISNEWFVLLSETCIPLFNFSIIYTYFMRSRYSFLGAFDDLGPYGRGRYNMNMTPEVKITQWRKGSQWFEISRKVAVTIVKDVTYYPKFKSSVNHIVMLMSTIFRRCLPLKCPISWQTEALPGWTGRGVVPTQLRLAWLILLNHFSEGFLRGRVVYTIISLHLFVTSLPESLRRVLCNLFCIWRPRFLALAEEVLIFEHACKLLSVD